jgi:hypothetical protein
LRLLIDKGKTQSDVYTYLLSTYNFKVALTSLRRRLVEWDILSLPKKPGAKRNLEAFKVQILKWDNQGVNAQEIVALLVKEFATITTKSTVTKHLSLWNSPMSTWR